MKTWTWKNPLTWPMNVAVIASLIGATYLPIEYTLRSDSLAPTVLNYYESACQQEAREMRGIPPLTVDTSKGLVAWQRDHLNTPEGRDYNKAVTACPEVGKFDFGSMTLVYREELP